MSDTPGASSNHPETVVTPADSRIGGKKVDAPATSRVLLVGYGILAGIFLLYAIGWALGLSRQTPISGLPPASALSQFMTIITAGLAIASGPLWFASVYILTRKNRTPVKLAWQVLGVILLVPWVFIVPPLGSGVN